MATTYYENIQKLYVAYFNRPADTAGLAYWETIVENAKGSTTNVSAAFAADTEYKLTFKDMTNAQIVDKVYQNLFGRAAEVAGRDYWANLLDKKAITIDKVVTEIATGAQDNGGVNDKTVYANKVKAAVAFTAALDTTAEQTGYNGAEANVIAKTFLSGVTTDASLTAALVPANLNASVAKVVAAGTPFTLANGLTALDAAVTAKADFLAAADGDSDAKTSTTDAAIGAKVTTAIANLDGSVAGDYTGSSVAVRAALLGDQQTANATKLAADQKVAAESTVAIAKVAGLSAAIASLDAATSSVKAGTDAVKAADADVAAKLASYNVLNTAAVTVAADGSVAGLIAVDADTKKLVLVTGVTEAKNPGVSALLAASVAHEAADATLASSVKAQGVAQVAVDGLDLTAAAKADLTTIASAMTIVKLDAGVVPTSAQITTELSTLDAMDKSAAAIAAQAGSTQAQKDAAVAAHTAFTTFDGLVTTFKGHDDANPLVAADTAAKAAVTADAKAIADLAKLVSALDAANSTAAQLKAVDSTIKLAQDAFTSHDLALPVSLTGSMVATAGADIFVAGKTDASIINFGLLGNDSLFIGSQYTLNTGKLTAGNNAVLEAFVVNNNGNAEIKLEKTAFGSNAAVAEVVTITLTGVAADHVVLSNGIITVV